MELQATALEQVQQVSLGILRDVPDCPGLDRYIGRLFHILQYCYRVTGKLQDVGNLGEGPVKFPLGFHDLYQVGGTPELLGLSQILEDDEGNEAVRIRFLLY